MDSRVPQVAYNAHDSEQGMASARPEASVRRRASVATNDFRDQLRQQLDREEGPQRLPQSSKHGHKMAAGPKDWKTKLGLFTLYFVACIVGGRFLLSLSAPHIELCQQCTGSCGKLSHGYMIPHEDMGGLPFGAILSEGTSAQCVDSFCVPKAVKDPWGLCTAIQQDASLLHGMKRRLMSAEEAEGDAARGQNKWTQYFSGRRLSGIGMANSPLGSVGTPPPAVSSTAQSCGYTFPLINNPSLLEDISTGTEGCSFIAYNNGPGYINTTDQPYMAFSGVKSYGQCCHLCAADSTCSHFTATSSDATTPGNCYLKSTSSPDNTAIVGTAIPGLSQFPWIRYVDSGYPGVMASGAKSSGVWKGPDVPTNAFGKPMPNQ